MTAIGIIGSDSTHTENYGRILNQDIAAEGLRAVKIWGTDPEETRQKAEMVGIPTVVSRPEDAMEGVDAVLVLNRWGDEHFKPAMLAVERGLPLFVDKPMTDDPREAVELTRAARQAGIPFMSASSLRYDPAMVELGQRLRDLGPIRGLSFAVGNDWRLYGTHPVDVMLSILGAGVADVTSLRDELNDLVLLRWPDGRFGVVTQMRELRNLYHCAGHAAGGSVQAETTIDSGPAGVPVFYVETMRVFKAMLDSGEWPIEAEELVEVIRVVAAADQSARERRTVRLEELPAL
jgi:predicted dehydrogenase